MPTPPPTLREIASLLGVSHTTVSLALKNSQQISKARRDEVQQLAAQLGYSPNMAAKALAHFKQDSHAIPIQSSIAWINAWPQPKQLRQFYEYDCYWHAAEKTLATAGYRLDEFIIDDQLTLKRLGEILKVRNVQGIIIPPQLDFVADDWKAFPWGDFSVVRIGRSMTAVSAHTAAPDQSANAMFAFRQIQQHGYRRVGFVGLSDLNHAAAAGVLLANSRVPSADRVNPLLCEKPLNSLDSAKFEEWFLREKPDAILCDQPALPGLLKKAGLRAPEDVGLAALCVSHCSADAGIDPHGLAIGESAARTLLSQLRAHEYGVPEILKEVLIRGSWVDGASLPRRVAT